MHFLEAEVVHEIGHAGGHDDGLARGDGAEGAAVEVIEMRVGDEDEVDVGQVGDGEAGALEPLDDDEPVGPVGIDEDVVPRRLDEERGVADPGDGDLAGLEFGENGALLRAGLAGEERGAGALR